MKSSQFIHGSVERGRIDSKPCNFSALLWLLLAGCLLLLLSGCGAEGMAPTEAAAMDTSAAAEEAAAPEDAASVDQEEAAVAGDVLDPRTLITLEEVTNLLGEPVNEPEYTANDVVGQKILFFDSVSEELPLRFFQLSVTDTAAIPAASRANGVSAAQIYSQTRDMLSDDNLAVTGYGDEAFWGTNGLHILKGDHYLLISVGNTDLEENLELAKRFADVIIDRVP